MGGMIRARRIQLTIIRLSRPSLAHQFALPNAQDLGISPSAALAYPAPPTSPTASPNTRTSPDAFILSPVLNLPETFGSAYVGETFSCTLCANNELSPSDKTRVISGVKIQGEMQTPSTPAGSPLELEGEEESSPGPGDSLQRILRFELKEEGNHVLAVTVTYTETTLAGEGMAASGKVRTFRKLYQFVALQLLSVRTKTGQVGDGTKGTVKVLLEAQLENVGEVPISFEVCLTAFPMPPRLVLAPSDETTTLYSSVSVEYNQGPRFSAPASRVHSCSVDHRAASGISSDVPECYS
jgi:hypothetical protein